MPACQALEVIVRWGRQVLRLPVSDRPSVLLGLLTREAQERTRVRLAAGLLEAPVVVVVVADQMEQAVLEARAAQGVPGQGLLVILAAMGQVIREPAAAAAGKAATAEAPEVQVAQVLLAGPDFCESSPGDALPPLRLRRRDSLGRAQRRPEAPPESLHAALRVQSVRGVLGRRSGGCLGSRRDGSRARRRRVGGRVRDEFPRAGCGWATIDSAGRSKRSCVGN